ncbi:bacteriorhodopsin [Sphingomonas lenta]|uniref:Rhodopsin n=1 Tax=Sphingomonas lenta TaxID=1141887 RepID=A0A2A2SI75_9SPHN|nr:bacteriorhodopsin [Sphingomonas lenta]PAX08977.1 rhodopsin [Sphingomonas lenta]
MPNLENFIAFENWQYEVIRHLLQLTVAAFAAGLVYFLATSQQVSPRYRLASTISGVVMVSAVLEIGQLYIVWSSGFNYVDGLWRPAEGYLFSNGFRYINWSIDVPMLLTQLLVVLGLTGRPFWSEWWKLTIAGVLMVWTGYVGQFYEPAVAGLTPDVSGAPFWIWGAVSTVFFVYLLYKVGMLVGRPPEPLDEDSRRNLKYCWWILLFSWTLYPFAYGVPAVWANGNGMVARQMLFTVADITSKLIFGVVLGRVARLRSKQLGWEPALLVDAEVPPPRAPVQASVDRA